MRMTVPIPPPTARRPPPDPRASSTFSLSLLPCHSIYLVSLHESPLRLPSSAICDGWPDCCPLRSQTMTSYPERRTPLLAYAFSEGRPVRAGLTFRISSYLDFR